MGYGFTNLTLYFVCGIYVDLLNSINQKGELMIEIVALSAAIFVILIYLMNNIDNKSSKKSNLPYKQDSNSSPAPVCAPARNNIQNRHSELGRIVENKIRMDHKEMKIIYGDNYEKCNFYIYSDKRETRKDIISKEIPNEIETDLKSEISSSSIIRKMLDSVDKNLLFDEIINRQLFQKEFDFKRLKGRN